MEGNEENSYKFFQNKNCQYFPCHKTDHLNCLLCYCPIYFLDCQGSFTILENGVKDCSNCNIPHSEGGYDYIVKFIKEYNIKRKQIDDIYKTEEYLNDNDM